jgi:hypothetical protein
MVPEMERGSDISHFSKYLFFSKLPYNKPEYPCLTDSTSIILANGFMTRSEASKAERGMILTALQPPVLAVAQARCDCKL